MPDLTVLDASAVLAWRDQEPGAYDMVEEVLDGALLSAVNAGEVRYKAADTGDDPDGLIADLVALGLEIVPFTDDQARHFPWLRALDRNTRPARKAAGTGRRSSLSLADLACLALAISREARVITGEGHWESLSAQGLTVPVIDYHRGGR